MGSSIEKDCFLNCLKIVRIILFCGSVNKISAQIITPFQFYPHLATFLKKLYSIVLLSGKDLLAKQRSTRIIAKNGQKPFLVPALLKSS